MFQRTFLTSQSTVYNFGKVLWKMHNCSDEILGTAKRISYQPAIDAFIRAVEACPEKRDSRHPDKDPVLEPHYKLLSVVHKLVRSKRVSVSLLQCIVTQILAKRCSLMEVGKFYKQHHMLGRVQTSRAKRAGMVMCGKF